MKFLLALVINLFFLQLVAAPQDEALIIQELINTTQKNLEAQQAVLKILVEYNTAREAFITDPDSSKLATRLVKKAMRLQNHIEQEHLAHLFSADFITELSFYNQVGKRLAHKK